MRERGVEPQFDRLLRELLRAREAWHGGEHERVGRILKVIGSIATAESVEFDPDDITIARAEHV